MRKFMIHTFRCFFTYRRTGGGKNFSYAYDWRAIAHFPWKISRRDDVSWIIAPIKSAETLILLRPGRTSKCAFARMSRNFRQLLQFRERIMPRQGTTRQAGTAARAPRESRRYTKALRGRVPHGWVQDRIHQPGQPAPWQTALQERRAIPRAIYAEDSKRQRKALCQDAPDSRPPWQSVCALHVWGQRCPRRRQCVLSYSRI